MEEKLFHNSLSWVAGFFDGEGSVGVYREKNNFFLQVEICNTQKGIMRALNSVYGGKLYCKQPRDYWRPCYQLRWRGTPAYNFLKLIQPEIRIKAQEIRLALEFVDRFGGRGRFGAKTYQNQIKQKTGYVNKIKELKRKPRSV